MEYLFEISTSIYLGLRDFVDAFQIKLGEGRVVQDHGSLGNSSDRRHLLADSAIDGPDRLSIADVARITRLAMSVGSGLTVRTWL